MPSYSRLKTPHPSHDYKEHIVDTLLPAREVHLLSGASGAGKTTWLFWMLNQWRQGRPVLGYASHPSPCVYVSCDRSEASVLRTLDRFQSQGIDLSWLPYLPARELGLTRTGDAVRNIVSYVHESNPEIRVFYIEGFSSLIGKSNDYKTVEKFLGGATTLCQERNVTILGICHATKLKENETYMLGRERILGSAAWGAYSETCIVIELVNPKDHHSTLRRLRALVHNGPETIHYYDLK